VTRAPAPEDRDGYLALFGDPDVERWLRPPPLEPFREAEILDLLSGDGEHWATHGFGPWAIFERGSEELVGRGGLRWTEIDDRLVIELPWAIRSDRWGRGYASEAALAAIDWAREMEVEEVVALVRAENAASRSVAEKAGMSRAGTARHAGLEHLVFRLRPRRRPPATRDASRPCA